MRETKRPLEGISVLKAILLNYQLAGIDFCVQIPLQDGCLGVEAIDVVGVRPPRKVAAGLITCFVLLATRIIDKCRRREIGIGSSHER